MTNNMSVIEQETTDAVGENRRTLTDEIAKINRDPDLSDFAKGRYLEEANQRARERHAEIVAEHKRFTEATLEASERAVFKVAHSSSHVTQSQREAFVDSYRDSAFKVINMAEEDLSRMMTRAERIGDRALEQACYHESVERGLFGIANEYREKHPDAKKAWSTYSEARLRVESNEALLGRALLSRGEPGAA